MPVTWTGNDKPLAGESGPYRTVSYEVIGDTVGPTDQFAVDVPAPCGSIALVESYLITAGTAATLAPAVGRKAGFAVGDSQEVYHEATPAVRIYSQPGARYQLGDGRSKLWVQPTPNAGTATKVLVRITFTDAL